MAAPDQPFLQTAEVRRSSRSALKGAISRAALAALLLPAVLPGVAQPAKQTPPTLQQLEQEVRRHPTPKLYVTLGLAYWDHNDYPRALEAFKAAVKAGPASAEAHNWLGVAVLRTGNFAAAIGEFRKAISLDPKYARAYTNLGSALAKSGDLAGSVAPFRKALALEPNNVAAHLNLGVALRENGDAKGALPYLQFAAQRAPKSAPIRYAFGQTLQQNGDLAGAIQAFSQAVRLDPEYREAYYALGVALKQQGAAVRKPPPPAPSPADAAYRKAQQAVAKGDLNAAAGLLQEALSQDANHAETQNLLGFILGQQGDLASALPHLRRAAELEPGVAAAHYNLGVALWYSGSKTQAIPELQRAVQLDPAAGASYGFLGVALRETNRLDEAEGALQRAIALLPTYPATYIDLGVLFLRRGDLNEALAQFEAGMNVPTPAGPAPDWDSAIAGLRSALSGKPGLAEAHNVLGLLLGHKGATAKDVEAEFREAVRLQPDFAEAHNNLGLVLAQNNDDKGAIAEFRQALKIAPDYADAHANLGSVLTATDPQEAVRELQKAVALAPENVKAQFNLAVAYAQDPNYGRAKQIEQLRKVVAMEPGFPRAHLELGRALLSDNQLEESAAELRRAVQLDPQSTAAHYQLGLALSRTGHKQEAAAELQKSRTLASSDDRKQNSDLDIAEGRMAMEDGKLDHAAAMFRHALQLQPNSADAEHLLGMVLEKQGDTQGALAAYRKTVELNPGDDVARQKVEGLSPRLAPAADDPQRMSEFESYIRAGRFPELEPLLSDYLKQYPNSSWGWYALGYSYFAQRKIGDSIQALAKSLQLDVKNAEAHKILGRDLMVIGRYDAAQTEFEQGVQYEPQSAEMHFDMGKLYSIQDRWKDARDQFATALRLDPSYVEGLDGLGFAQDALGDDAGAVASYEKAIALDEARHGTLVSPRVNLSAHYIRKGNYEKALEYANEALKLDPKSDGALFQRARAREAMGQLKEAADDLNRAVALNPRASSYYYVLSQVDRRLGKVQESNKALDSFMRLEKETESLEKIRRKQQAGPGTPDATPNRRD